MQNENTLLTDFAAWAVDDDACRHAPSLLLARLALLDTLGCMIAGAQERQVHQAAAAMSTAGTFGAARSVANKTGYSLPAAALINGTAAHVQDFDDYDIPASTHPSAPVYGAISAFVDTHPCTLGDVLEAFATGYEIIVRIGQSLGGYDHYMAGWHATSTIGPFGAAAAASKMLGLGAEPMANALSMAASMSAGLKAQFGTDTKALQAGLAARAGVEAALLAQTGLTASPDILVGEYAYLARYSGQPPLSQDPMTGQMHALSSYPILRKPWPSCAYSHRSIESALALNSHADFSPAQVEAVTIHMAEPYFRVVPFLNPTCAAEARFSVTWCVAVSLVDGAITPDSFADHSLARSDVRDMVSRISVDPYEPEPGLTDISVHAPDTVTLRMLSGHEISHSIGHVKGGEKKPMSEREVHEKFLACGGSENMADNIMNGALETPFRFFT